MSKQLLLCVLPLLALVLHLSNMAAAQDSQLLAVQTTDGIALLDTSNNLEIRSLPNSYPTGYMAWSENGRYLSYYGSFLNEETGLQVFDMLTEDITMLDASPPGALPGTLNGLWFRDEILYYATLDFDNGALFRTRVPDAAPEVLLEGFVILGQPNGNYVTISQGHDWYLLALPTGELTPLRQGIEQGSPTWRDDSHLFYAVNDAAGVTVYLYDISTNTDTQLFNVNNSEINTLTWDNGMLGFFLVQDGGFQYTMWDGEMLTPQDEPSIYSPDDAYALRHLPGEGSRYSQLALWTRESNTWQTLTERSLGYTWSPASDHVAYTTRESIHIYSVVDGLTQTYTPCITDSCGLDIDYYSCGDWSPNGRWLICHANGYRDDYRYTYLLDMENETTLLLPDAIGNYRTSSVAWQPNGS